MMRIVAADVFPLLLQLVRDEIDARDEMEFVGEIAASESLSDALTRLQADLLIIGADWPELSEIDLRGEPSSEVLARHPELMVVAVHSDVRQIRIEAQLEASLLRLDEDASGRIIVRATNLGGGGIFRAIASVDSVRRRASTASLPDRRGAPHASADDHLRDELRRLDLLIRAELETSPAYREASEAAGRRDLVPRRAEVEDLLANATVPASSSLQEALREIAVEIESTIEGARADGAWLPLADLMDRFQLTFSQRRCLIGAGAAG